jgi:hypothetical protein
MAADLHSTKKHSLESATGQTNEPVRIYFLFMARQIDNASPLRKHAADALMRAQIAGRSRPERPQATGDRSALAR